MAQDNHTDLPEAWGEGPSATVKTQARGLILGVTALVSVGRQDSAGPEQRPWGGATCIRSQLSLPLAGRPSGKPFNIQCPHL